MNKNYIEYVCEICLRSFGNHKHHFKAHTNRKNPCKPKNIEGKKNIAEDNTVEDNTVEDNTKDNIVKNSVIENKKTNEPDNSKLLIEAFVNQINLLNNILVKKNIDTENNDLKKINDNVKKLGEIIPAQQTLFINTSLINTIIEKDKKIKELEELEMIKKFEEEIDADLAWSGKKYNKNSIDKICNNDKDNEEIDDKICNCDNNNQSLNDENIVNKNVYNEKNDISKIFNEKINNKFILILNDNIIECRESDGYVNATQLCKAGGKNFSQWYRLESTNKLINFLKTNVGINTLDLIDKKVGGNHEGTWIYPDLAIQLAQWLSPEFAVQVSHWIRNLFSEGNVEIDLKSLCIKQENTIKECESRIKYLENLILKRHKRTKYPKSNVVYLVTDKKSKKENEYVIGKTINLTNRLSTYNKTEDFEVIYYKGFESEEQMDLAETMVLERLNKYRKQANRDIVILPTGENIKIFTDAIDKVFAYFN